jgi:hypothetical protein
LLALAAESAGASTWVGDPSGQIEICKTSVTGNLAVNGPFTFTVTGGTVAGGNTVTVNVGSCSQPLTVSGATGNVTIHEATASWYKVTAITALAGSSYLIQPPASPATSVALQNAVVSLSTTTISEVNFTNTIVPGYVEVCKNAAVGSGLTGPFTFTVNSDPIDGVPLANRVAGDPWTQTATANVGACSQPIEMPAGDVDVTENGTNLYVTNITATNAAGATNLLEASNFVTGKSVVEEAAAPAGIGDFSQQTDVWYTNNVVGFKICKIFNGLSPVASYPFTYSANGGAPVAVSVVPGQCSIPVSFPAGTSVAVTEGIVPGTEVAVGGIVASGADSEVPGSNNVVTRTETVILGTPTTIPNPSFNSALPVSATNPATIPNPASAPGNEGVVTYTNRPAAPGELKICKLSPPAGVLAPIGTSFAFTLSGGVTGSVVVPLGDCVIVPNSTGGQLQIPFNSAVTVTETPSTGNAVYAISVSPTNLEETNAITATDPGGVTTLPVISGAPNLTAGTVTVQIGESDTTEVDYTNTDPPVVTPGSGNSGTTGSVTVNNPGTQGGTTTALSLSGATSVASGIATVSAAAPVVSSSSVVKITTLSPAQKKALLKHDEKTLANAQKTLSKDLKKFNHMTGRKAVAEAKVIAGLRSEVRALNSEIKSLKK